MQSIGERIKEARLRAGLSQTELAARLGYSKSAINKVEKGTRDIPRAAVDRYASVLGVTSAYLNGWDDNEILQSMIHGSEPVNPLIEEVEGKCKTMDDAQLRQLSAYADFLINLDK